MTLLTLASDQGPILPNTKLAVHYENEHYLYICLLILLICVFITVKCLNILLRFHQHCLLFQSAFLSE